MPACFLTYRPESLKELFSGCCDPETTHLVLRETNSNFVEREIPDIQIEIGTFLRRFLKILIYFSECLFPELRKNKSEKWRSKAVISISVATQATSCGEFNPVN